MSLSPSTPVWYPSNISHGDAFDSASIALFGEPNRTTVIRGLKMTAWDGELRSLPNHPVVIAIDYARGLPNCLLDDLVNTAERVGHLLIYQGRHVCANGSVHKMDHSPVGLCAPVKRWWQEAKDAKAKAS